MCIRPKWGKDLFIPDFTLGGRKIDFVPVKKYLRCYISNHLCDCKHIIHMNDVFIVKETYVLSNLDIVLKIVKIKLAELFFMVAHCGLLFAKGR